MAVERARAGAEFCADLDFGHVLHQQRFHGGAKFQRQILNLLSVAHTADGSNRELFAATADNAATGVLHVLGDEAGQFAERHVNVGQRFGLGLNDELPFIAAALVDFGDARHGAQQGFDDVFLNFAQFDELFQLGGRFVGRVGTILDVVIKNFTQARADGRKFRTRAGRQFFQDALQTFSHKLAGAKNVRPVSEIQCDLR